MYTAYGPRKPEFGALVVGADGTVLESDATAAEAFGMKADSLAGVPVRELGLAGAVDQVRAGTADRGCDLVRAESPAGEDRWLCVVRDHESGPEGTVRLWVYPAGSAGKRIETAAGRLREAQHRVKNDLNFVASALIDSECGEANRAQAADQIRSIAALYDLLAHSGEEHIDAAAYLSAVADIHTRRLRAQGNRIRIVNRLEPASMKHTTATLAGIVLNELLTNATKHAFGPETPSGEIRVESRASRGRMVLTVSDDGAGMAGTVQSGMGLGLVRDIIGSVGGNLELRAGGGFTCVADFPSDGPG